MSRVNNNFWRKTNRPIKVLSPMVGYTDSAFRLMCKKLGADVVISELISADAIAYAKLKCQKLKVKTNVSTSCSNTYYKVITKNQALGQLLSFFEAERPFVIQLFGKNPENFAKAAKWLEENLKPDGIDINMGCPARKVVGSDHGVALLKNPELAVKIVKAVVDNCHIPVSVKTRLGWENDGEILEFAPLLVNAGISALIIHGRTYKDGFKGSARWENIYKVKKMFGDKLIVIGNGDIGAAGKSEIKYPKFKTNSNHKKSNIKNRCQSYQLSASSCSLDGYAIGRASFGKPWIFTERNSSQFSTLSFQLLKEIILEHAKLSYIIKEEKGIIEFRKHLLAYLRGFSNAKKIRMEAIKIQNIDKIEAILSQLEL